MISDTCLDHQINRLMALRNRPQSVEGVEMAYREAARNADHAARITAHILRYSEFFPTPHEVYEASATTLQPEDMPKQNRNCKACGGTGWEHGWQLVTYHKTENGGVYKSVDLIFDPEVAQKLQASVDGKGQMLYSGVRSCRACRPAEAKPPEPQKTKNKSKISRFTKDDTGDLIQ